MEKLCHFSVVFKYWVIWVRVFLKKNSTYALVPWKKREREGGLTSNIRPKIKKKTKTKEKKMNKKKQTKQA